MGFLKIFYSLDLFQRPIYLHFKDKEKLSTKLGLFLSVIIYAIIIYTLATSDIFRRNYPRIYNSEGSSKSRPLIDFNNKMLAVMLTDEYENQYYDPTIFSINAKSIYFKRNSKNFSNFEIVYSENKELVNCSKSSYQQSVISAFGINKFFCLKNNSFSLEGFFDEATLKTLILDVSACDNLTMNNTCKTPTEIKNFMRNKKFNFLYSDNVIDLQNYDTPITEKFHNEFQILSSSVKKIVNIYYKKVNILTDDGLFSHNPSYQDTFVFDNRETDFVFDSSDQNMENLYLLVQFFSATNSNKMERYYQNFAELFATLGGLLNSLIILGFFLSYVEKNLYLTQKIMNNLYSFQPDKKQLDKIRTIRTMIEKNSENINPLIPHHSDTAENILHQSHRSPETNSMRKSNIQSSPELNHDNLQNFIELAVIKEESNQEEKFPAIQNNYSKAEGIAEKIDSLLIKNQINTKETIPNFASTEKLQSDLRIRHVHSELYQSEVLSDHDKVQTPRLAEANKRISIENLEKKPSEETKTNSESLADSEKTHWYSLKNIRKKVKNFTNLYKKKEEINKETAENLPRFQEFQDSKNKIIVNLCNYFKLQCSRVFCCKTSFKEKLFIRAQELYAKELDIVHILRRLQEIEKMKLVLFNPKQLVLFNLLAKPMIYLEENKSTGDNRKEGGYRMSEIIKSTMKKDNLKEAIEFYENVENRQHFNEIDRRLFQMLDSNVNDFLKYFQ